MFKKELQLSFPFSILSSTGLPITLNLYTVNFLVFVSTHKPLTIYLFWSLKQPQEGGRASNRSTISQRALSSWQSPCQDHTQLVTKLGSESRCPCSSPCALSFSCVRVQEYSCLDSVESSGQWSTETEEARAGGLQWERQGALGMVQSRCGRQGAEVTAGYSPPALLPVSCSQALPVLL